MFRLMIVEDEPIVLEGMLKIIDFEEHGFEVVRVCKNGKEALEQFAEVRPDVVITDICMDLMDGLEFIEKAREQDHRTKFVVVSGHQDFKFVKKALSLKVLDYILKPVTAKEFRELLMKISKELNEKKVDLKLFEEMQKSAKELEKNVFMNNLMNLQLGEDEVWQHLQKYDIVFDKNYLRVSILKMKNLHSARKKLGYDSSNALLNDMYFKMIQQCDLRDNLISFTSSQGYILVIVKEDKIEDINNVNKQFMHHMREHFPEKEGVVLQWYSGIDVKKAIELSESFKSADTLIKKGVLKTADNYYDANDLLRRRKNKSYDYTDDVSDWVINIIFYDAVAYENLDEIYDRAFEAGYLLSDFKKIASAMMDSLVKEMENIKVTVPDFFADFEPFSQEQLMDYLKEITEKSIELIRSENLTKEEYITRKAEKYIHEHYSDFDFDLNEICDYLDVSISHFSSVFKRNTGKTFIKYVNSFRIERAKHFLENTKHSIAEVSEMAGYVDPHYFGIVFKKYAKTAPKNYRTLKKGE